LLLVSNRNLSSEGSYLKQPTPVKLTSEFLSLKKTLRPDWRRINKKILQKIVRRFVTPILADRRSGRISMAVKLSVQLLRTSEPWSTLTRGTGLELVTNVPAGNQATDSTAALHAAVHGKIA